MPSIFQYMSKCKDLKLRHITADTNKPNKISDMLYQSSTNHVQIRHILVWQQPLLRMHSIGQCSSLITAFTLQTEISINDSHTKRRATSVATSLAVLGRSIGRPDGPDQTSPRHFAKKPLNSGKIEPAVCPPLLGFFYKKTLDLCTNSTRRPRLHMGLSANHSVGLSGPNSAWS